MPLRSINEPAGYVFDGMSPNSINEPLKVAGDPYAPKITSLSPNSCVAGSANTTLFVTGTGLFSASVIFINGGNRVTKLEADGRLSTPIRPSTWTPQTAKVQVRNGVYSSNNADLVFTAADKD